MKEFLDSDRVNFLVWRYLLEGNYRETAAKFQKEWHIPEPQRQFDFAPHVKSHSLVQVLNRGLLYYSIERDFNSHNFQKASGSQPVQQLGVFGPLVTQPPPRRKEIEHEQPPTQDAPSTDAPSAVVPSLAAGPARSLSSVPSSLVPLSGSAPALASVSTALTPAPASADDDTENARKRQSDRQLQPTQNGSSIKKPRLSNGHDAAGATAAAVGGMDAAPPTPMDIENQHAYPSPMERESAMTPVPRTEGPEHGTQVDKVEELATETTFLRLAPDRMGDDERMTDRDSVDESQPGHENPIVLHCEWNPANPSVLAAAGSDALARIWTLSRSAGGDPVTEHVNGHNNQHPYKDLVDEEDGSSTSTVTAMAWNPDGNTIALAVDSGNRGRVSIWAPDGTALLHYMVHEPPVIKLRWNPNGASILGITPENGGTLVTVFSAVTSSTVSYMLPDHDLTADPLDTAWTSDTDFLLCGGDLFLALRLTENGIVVARAFATKKDDNFVQIQYDWQSRLVATASEKGDIDLWDEFGERRTLSAHLGLVTALVWQPPQSNSPLGDERLLASGGEDGAISIWNTQVPDSKPKCSMTMDQPVVALAFTPDGAFIAGATPDRILIWKMGDHAVPRASWRRTPHPGWLSPKVNVENEEEDTHCLCWDTTGQRLAYGVNNRLAVINFR